MTSLPSLRHWEDSAHSLHRAAGLLGAIRMLLLDPVPNYLELSLVIRPEGLSTGVLPSGLEIVLDFQRCALASIPPAGESRVVPLAGHSQASLLEALLALVEAQGIPLVARSNGRVTRAEAFLAALEARGHVFLPKRADLLDDTPLVIDAKLSADYSDALYRVFTATARFRARLNGPMTPVVVWPEHFDLSFLWFATSRATDKFPHMNFGFAPFSDGIDRPYLYVYAYPMPDGFAQLPLPKLARWNTEGWSGMVVPYDDLVGLADPETAIEEIFAAMHSLLAPALPAAAEATRE